MSLGDSLEFFIKWIIIDCFKRICLEIFPLIREVSIIFLKSVVDILLVRDTKVGRVIGGWKLSCTDEV